MLSRARLVPLAITRLAGETPGIGRRIDRAVRELADEWIRVSHAEERGNRADDRRDEKEDRGEYGDQKQTHDGSYNAATSNLSQQPRRVRLAQSKNRRHHEQRDRQKDDDVTGRLPEHSLTCLHGDIA